MTSVGIVIEQLPNGRWRAWVTVGFREAFEVEAASLEYVLDLVKLRLVPAPDGATVAYHPV